METGGWVQGFGVQECGFGRGRGGGLVGADFVASASR